MKIGESRLFKKELWDMGEFYYDHVYDLASSIRDNLKLIDPSDYYERQPELQMRINSYIKRNSEFLQKDYLCRLALVLSNCHYNIEKRRDEYPRDVEKFDKKRAFYAILDEVDYILSDGDFYI